MGEYKNIAWGEVDGGYRLTKRCAFAVSVRPNQVIIGEDYSLNQNGLLILQEGFFWDGASGPALDTQSNMRSSLVHDALIGMVQRGELENTWENKVAIDGEYWRLSRTDRMNWFRACYHLLIIQWNQWQNKIWRIVK